MRSDGGAVFTHVEQQLPQFIQTKHPKFAKFVEKYYEFLELIILFNKLCKLWMFSLYELW